MNTSDTTALSIFATSVGFSDHNYLRVEIFTNPDESVKLITFLHHFGLKHQQIFVIVQPRNFPCRLTPKNLFSD
ncbi:hypothetical protein HORM4_20056 [Vibrio harveyi]|nr:hypothetical protein HORM4_20056 [Vibrio harveyi]